MEEEGAELKFGRQMEELNAQRQAVDLQEDD
jgi:hypothetical protein